MGVSNSKLYEQFVAEITQAEKGGRRKRCITRIAWNDVSEGRGVGRSGY